MLRADPFTDEADKGVAKAWRLGVGIVLDAIEPTNSAPPLPQDAGSLARRFGETAALTAARRQRGVGWRGARALHRVKLERPKVNRHRAR